MNVILRKLDRGRHLLSAASYPALWRQWRLPLGVSLALSLLILALVLSAAYLGGDGAAASPLAQPPFDLSISRGEGECTVCRQADPLLYDSEMGYFNLNCSGCPINDTTYVWSRTPFFTDTHSLDSPAYNSFYFWLHRNKGCGDFQMWGMSGNDTVTNIAPFSIPCTGGLGDDTIETRVSHSPEPGVLFFPPGQEGYDSATIFTERPTIVTYAAENRTVTEIHIEIVALELCGDVVLGGLQVIGGPGTVAYWDIRVEPNCPQMPQAMDLAAASPARVTGTLVFSFGPTARISQTLVIARPYRALVPLATKEWGSGW